MATATDDFNRPDSLDLGPNWSPQAGQSLQIISGTVRAATLGQGTEEQYTAFTPASGKMYAQILIRLLNTDPNTDAGVIIRAADVGTRTFYHGSVIQPVGSQIIKRVNGAAVVIASELSTVWAINDILRLEADGSTITLKRNGVIILSVTDLDITFGRGGIRMREDVDLTLTRVRDFEVGDLVAVPQNVITWQDNSGNEDGFLIQRKAESCLANTLPFADLATVGPNVVSYIDTNVTPGGTYAYRVRAFNTFGPSAFTQCADRLVPGGDVTFPIVTINFPTTDSSYITSVATELGGTATDDVGIASMAWSSDRGASGLINFVSGNWVTIGLAPALQLGVNNITVSATDSSGNTSIDQIAILYGVTTGIQGNNPRMVGLTY